MLSLDFRIVESEKQRILNSSVISDFFLALAVIAEFS